MTISAAGLITPVIATAAQTIATGSITLTSGKLYLLWAGVNDASLDPALPTTPSGWTYVTTATQGTAKRRLTLYIRDGDGSTGSHTIDHGASYGFLTLMVDEWTGAAAAASAVVQSKAAVSPSGAVTMTSNIASANNAITLGEHVSTSYATIAEEAGYTGLSKRQSAASVECASEYRVGADAAPPTPTFTNQYSPASAMIGVEIAAATATSILGRPVAGRFGRAFRD